MNHRGTEDTESTEGLVGRENMYSLTPRAFEVRGYAPSRHVEPSVSSVSSVSLWFIERLPLGQTVRRPAVRFTFDAPRLASAPV